MEATDPSLLPAEPTLEDAGNDQVMLGNFII